MISTNRSKTLLSAAALVVLAGAAVFFYHMSKFDTDTLRVHLIKLLPIWLEINVTLIIIAFALCSRTLYSEFVSLERRHKYYLAAIVLLAFGAAFFIAPRVHRIFYDENIYLNIGQNIAYLGRASMCNDGDNIYGVYKCSVDEFNKQPYGYPFLLAMAFRLVGSSEALGHLLNNIFFSASAVVVFLIARNLFGDIRVSLCSSLIYVLIPHNIIWGNTAAVEPSTALFTGMTVMALLHFLKEKTMSALFLFSALLPLSLQFRFESILILPVLLMLIVLNDWKILKTREFYLFMALSLVLALAHMLQLYTVRGDSWGASGAKMSLSFMLHNLKTNGMFYLDDKRFPMIVTLLFAVGVFYRRDYLRERLVIAAWFVLFWGVFLTFYAGSYDYGQDVRYSVVSYMPLSLLAGLGLSRLWSIVVSRKYITVAAGVIFVMLILARIPYIRAEGEEAWECRVDHVQAREMFSMVDRENSVILTHNPGMFLLWGANAAQTSTLTYNANRMNYFFERYGNNVYFHYNYWCNVDNPVQKKFCQDILNTFECERISFYTVQNRIFALYRIKRK
ncbi:MAG: glycosyltransferase family 39 protein [Nitrospirota bacterium]